MGSETINLDDIKVRDNTDWKFKRDHLDPVSGYRADDGPPTASISSQDETDVTLTVSDDEPGRANDVAFRVVKDLMALAAIIKDINNGIGGAPKQYVRVNAVDTQADYLIDKLVDGPGVKLSIIDAAGVKSVNIEANAKRSVEIDSDFIQLVGDITSPGNNKVYGTGPAGSRGWYSASIPVTGSYLMLFLMPAPPPNWTVYTGFAHHSKIIYTLDPDGSATGGTRDATLNHNHVFNHTHLVSGNTSWWSSNMQDQGSGGNDCAPEHDHTVDIWSQNSNPSITSNNTQERYLKAIAAYRSS